MNGLSIYLADGTYDGTIIMTSTASKFSAVRVKRNDVPGYNSELNGPGIYLLLVDNDSVYVGQTGLDTINKRIFNTHSGNIDSSWHTVVGFKCSDHTISSNELQYIENAMCEFAHTNYSKCLTTTPAKTNCNSAYRNSHYHLSIVQMHSCNQYIEDIKYYISIFPHTIFPGGGGTQITTTVSNGELFYFKSPTRDSDGKAEIAIHLGHDKARPALLKKGSKISKEVSDNFGSSQSIKKLRQQYIAAGKIVNRVLQEDIQFNSQSGAGQFLNGASFDGNGCWKTVNGDKKLKDLL